MINRDFETIYEALKKNKLAFFIGSGFSKAECKEYPLWLDVLETLKMDLAEGNKEDSLYKETDALKIAQFHRLKFGKSTTKKTTKDAFPKVAVPGDLTKRLLNLYPHCIVTTNWDCFFDNAVNNGAYIYDVIAADYELVESENNSKIIKMHGDFEHDNYVFTEDDYLNYRKNFPLIENYVKSIISTHVVIFLGYSFNDIDMKQIFNWFREKSTVQPAAYMVQVGANEVLKSYLKKFGITVLNILPSEEKITNESYAKAIDLLIANVENFEENKYSNNPFDYVATKIKKYNSYPVVLHDQITKSLGNCKIIESIHNKNYLQFYDKILTSDYNRKKRDIYKKFVELLNNEDWLKKNKDEYKSLKAIFLKCNVSGVIYSDLLSGDILRHDFDGNCTNRDIEEFQNFCYCGDEKNGEMKSKMKYVYCLYNLKEYKHAYEENERSIEVCKTNKDWKNLFIAIFNQKVFSNLGRIESVSLNNQKWNIDDLYQKLPYEVQREYSDLYLFLKNGGLYAEYSNAQSNLDDLNKKVEGEKKGTVYGTSSKEYNPTVLDNLIYYILGNYICIDQYKIFKDICQKYLECCVLSQRKQLTLSFSKNELYVCMKFLEKEFIKQLLAKIDGKIHTIQLDKDTIRWLINVVINCSKNDNSVSYLNKALFILSMSKIENDDYKKIMNLLPNIILMSLKSQVLFSEIIDFVYYQKVLFKNSSRDLFEKIFDAFLQSIAFDNISEINMYYLKRENMEDLFKRFKFNYDKDELLKQFIAEVTKFPIVDQFLLRMNLLFPLYACSNSKCKSMIKKCVCYKNEKNEAIGTLDSVVTFNYLLSLQQYELKTWSNSFRSQLNKILMKMPQNFYTYHFDKSRSMLKKLCKKDSQCKPLLEDIEKRIKIHSNFFNE